jgi:uncharacterized protein YkwD
LNNSFILSRSRIFFVLVIVLVIALFGSAPANGQTRFTPRGAAANPPAIAEPASLNSLAPLLSSTAPTTEWIYHKSVGGQHPDGNEQQIVWLMNRARTNPTSEGNWLAESTDPEIAGGRDYFNVNLNVLKNEFASYAAKPPAAFDVRLYNAAKAHSDDLVARDAQDHTGQYARVTSAGFTCAGGTGYTYRGSVFSYASTALNAHAAWNIDWGPSPDGMQSERGHRKAVMSIDGEYTNMGVAAVYEDDDNTDVGLYVTTANYCHAGNVANHYNRFIVGTVWQDLDEDQQYDPGEGIGGVTVMPDQGLFYAVTGASGGYAIPITQAGTYQLAFSGAVNGQKSVVVNTTSVLLDYLKVEVLVYLPFAR